MTWRWIPPLTADGATQMALDRWMLQQLSEGGGPILRLYRWSRPTLSLGAHQRRLESHWPALVRQGVIELVRRPSGGRAVLHGGGELTYSLACLPSSPRRLEAYGQACRWLQGAFAALGQPLHFGDAELRRAQVRSSCFASGTAADLLQADGAKRIGSAQLWRGPALLQHGSLLLQPDAQLWRTVFGEEPPHLQPLADGGLRHKDLVQQLRAAAERDLCGGPLREQALSTAEWEAVQRIRQLQPEPDQGSRLVCIERAT